MAGIDRWKISPETRAKFEAILDEAPRLGIDRDQAAAAGLPGLRALIALKQMAEAGTVRAKKQALSEAQSALASLTHRKQATLVNQVQARLLALQGRRGDSEIAHVTRGEIVLPEALQSPQLMAVLRDAAVAHGIPFQVLRVGSPRNHRDPRTGAREFAITDPMTGQAYELPELDEAQIQVQAAEASRDPAARARAKLTEKPVWEGSINRKDKLGEGGGYYGDRRVSRTGAVYGHEGVDIQGDQGQPIYSMGPGRITSVQQNSDPKGYAPDGYGNLVIIDHGDGVETRYGHLYDAHVKVGDEVRAGQSIGRLGRTGNVPKEGDSHLHTEVRVDHKTIEPATIFPGYGRPPRRP